MLCALSFCFISENTAYDVRISDWSSDVCSSDLDLGGCGAAHDRVVDQQHHAVPELQRDRVELALDRLHALALPRHDEGAADVAVLDEALAVLHAEHVGQLHRRIARGVGDRDRKSTRLNYSH